MPCTAAGAGKASAATKGCAAGMLGPMPVAAIGEASAEGELGPAAELGPVASMALGVEVPIGGAGPWRTRGRRE